METLGSLCDKLTIVKLKQFHSNSLLQLESLEKQENLLVSEINNFILDAINHIIPIEKLSFAANKVYKGNETREITGSIGSIFAELAEVNCNLWHEQEKVYEFERVPKGAKDTIVKKLATLNLERNKCIDAINDSLIKMISNGTT